MSASLIHNLPQAPAGKSGWPWTLETDANIYDKQIYYPKITIVTPSYNQGIFIEETIRSVLLQNYPNLDYIIIDGGSTDNSVEIIKKYSTHLSYWVSEKDSGQSDAINKGLKKATGDIFNWLNSDDYFEPNAFYKVASAFMKNSLDCYIGDLGTVKDGKLQSLSEEKSVKEDYRQTFLNPNIKQPATFYSMELVNRFGPVNTQLHFAMDYEWWLKFLLMSDLSTTLEEPEFLVNFRYHNESKSTTSMNRFNRDMTSILFALAKALDDKSLISLFKGVPMDTDYQLNIDKKLILNKREIITEFIQKYLIERHSYIYLEEDFDILKNLNRNYRKANIKIPDNHNKHVAIVADRVPNWIIFKIYRKIKWILFKEII